MKEIKAKMVNVGARLKINEMGWQWWHACLQMSLLFSEIEEENLNVVDTFCQCSRRKS